MSTLRLAIAGARGYVGRELLQLVHAHPGFELAWASSREHNGLPLANEVPGMPGEYCLMQPDQLAQNPADIYVLALPNGLAEPWVAAIESADPDALILDLSADYRFNDDWVYGLPEVNGPALRQARRISNPGCYATAMQLALHPLLALGVRDIHCFGVSGYSGAGTKPSPNNDPDRLRENLKAYKLTGHIHEREVSRHLGVAVNFMPCVAGFFRGIQMTVSCTLDRQQLPEQINDCLATFYQQACRVRVQTDIPEISDVRETNWCSLGGATLGNTGQRLVLISVLDNLLKGAASQAIQNLNLACGFGESEGLGDE